MSVAESKFEKAIPNTSGVTAAHLRDIHWACQQHNTFLFGRPSTTATMRLIEAGFATKSMDIHDKSSDWGLTSGLVPVDQAFCKNLVGEPNDNIHPHGHGQAQVVHLCLQGSFDKLNGQGHFEHMTEVKAGVCTAAHSLAKYRHFHCDTKKNSVCFLLETATGKSFWHWRNKEVKRLVPIWVWGYKGTPVTGDYDMWMVAPHISVLSGDTSIYSNKDGHGRSAASGFTTKFIRALNSACKRLERPVFNHGAEAQNVSFTQPMDKRLVVFPAGQMAPFMITRLLLPGLLHDLLLHGYLVVRNPKWLNGVTLEIEDMADAASQFPDDGAVKAGVKARNKLENAAASKIQEFIRQNSSKGLSPISSNSDWKERYEQLRYFRAVGRMPDPTKAVETLLLPPRAFPLSGAGSSTDSVKEVTTLGRKLEQNFKRTGFIKEDGHVSPVDGSVMQQRPGEVKKLIQRWEQGGK